MLMHCAGDTMTNLRANFQHVRNGGPERWLHAGLVLALWIVIGTVCVIGVISTFGLESGGWHLLLGAVVGAIALAFVKSV
jgi:hypothetical protein